jgi:hypothetical protein
VALAVFEGVERNQLSYFEVDFVKEGAKAETSQHEPGSEK